MLVLQRRVDQDVIVGEGDAQARITVVDIRGDRVRLGFTVAKEIPVHRREVYEKIRRERARIQNLNLPSLGSGPCAGGP